MFSSLQFTNYYVSKIEYRYNPESSDVDEAEVNFSHEIKYENLDKIEVTINCKVTDEAGLHLEVELHGIFSVKIDEGSIDDPIIKTLCERNTLSILFPYLRSSISDISTKANIPPIILPTINVLAMLDKEPVDEK